MLSWSFSRHAAISMQVSYLEHGLLKHTSPSMHHSVYRYGSVVNILCCYDECVLHCLCTLCVKDRSIVYSSATPLPDFSQYAGVTVSTVWRSGLCNIRHYPFEIHYPRSKTVANYLKHLWFLWKNNAELLRSCKLFYAYKKELVNVG